MLRVTPPLLAFVAAIGDLILGTALAISVLPITSPLTVRYPSRSRTLTLEYKSDDGVAAYWGIWLNTGGWGSHRHFSIQPTTGRFDQIDRAIRTAPMGTSPHWPAHWSVRLTLGEIPRPHADSLIDEKGPQAAAH